MHLKTTRQSVRQGGGRDGCGIRIHFGVLTILAVLLMIAGCKGTNTASSGIQAGEEERKSTMYGYEDIEETTRTAIPSIDQAAPAQVKTATFAMG